MDILEKIHNKSAIVNIIGLGYVGLPIAMAVLGAGYLVKGIDINEENIKKLNQGISYVKDVSDEEIKKWIGKRFFVSSEYSSIKEADAILICVPTPLTSAKEPNLSYIESSVDEIIKYISEETLIVLESTTYPGTTESLIKDRIEQERNWTAGEQFFVCYSPERVDPGNTKYKVINTPKVIGGETETCLQVGKALYSNFIHEVVPVSSTKVAELSKLIENTFRCVNIALINEMTIMAERLDIDIWETIDAAKTKPFGFMPFYPGTGVGGHCIPLDPMYLCWEAKRHNYFNRFIELAMDVNTNMPYFVVRQIKDILLNEGKRYYQSKILLLGVSYKPDVADVRESSALELYRLLSEQNIDVSFYDPYVESFKFGDKTIHRIELEKQRIEEQDMIVITTKHSCVDYSWITHQGVVVYDTCNAIGEDESGTIYKLGQCIKCRNNKE